MTENKPDSIIPPEMQQYCDIYLEKLEAKREGIKPDAFKTLEALDRAITYYKQDPGALLREATYYLDNHPEYFGIKPEETSPIEDKPQITAPADKEIGEIKRKRRKPDKIGDVEKEIMADIESKFSEMATNKVIEKAKGKGIKGSGF